MKVKLKKVENTKKYSVLLSENEIKHLCILLNEKVEGLLRENKPNSEIKGLELNYILVKLISKIRK